MRQARLAQSPSAVAVVLLLIASLASPVATHARATAPRSVAADVPLAARVAPAARRMSRSSLDLSLADAAAAIDLSAVARGLEPVGREASRLREAAPSPAPPPAAARAAPAVVPVVAIAAVGSAEQRMLALINASRREGGLAALALDDGASIAALAHSAVESRYGYVYHDGPDGTAASRNVPACATGWYGENTGKIWNDNVDQLHREFMSEPWAPINHRTNIMDPAFRRIGIGAVRGRDALYMTMVFCR